MKILWVTNILMPMAAEACGVAKAYGGGWLNSLLDGLAQKPDLKMAVASVYDGKMLRTLETPDGVTHYLIPCRNPWKLGDRRIEECFHEIKRSFAPDVVHLHGTEYPWKNAALDVFPASATAVSIQGLLSVYAKYYAAGMSFSEIMGNITLRDIIKLTNVYREQADFVRNGNAEIDCIRRAGHIIGRTSWDKAHTLAINPDAKYHFCNESLRGGFYEPTWSIAEKEDFSIFLSQGSYPIKGLHIVLKAIALLKDKYPKIHVYVGGFNPVGQSLKHYSSYGRYIKNLIAKYDLGNYVTFTGPLDEESMIRRYLKSHLFVCPSSIENSPNSLGEAQILGVPCLASYVGGIPDMAANGSALLYRFEEYEMLAALIDELFRSPQRCLTLSASGRSEAKVRHDRNQNTGRMFEIYQNIVYDKSGKKIC